MKWAIYIFYTYRVKKKSVKNKFKLKMTKCREMLANQDKVNIPNIQKKPQIKEKEQILKVSMENAQQFKKRRDTKSDIHMKQTSN